MAYGKKFGKRKFKKNFRKGKQLSTYKMSRGGIKL